MVAQEQEGKENSNELEAWEIERELGIEKADIRHRHEAGEQLELNMTGRRMNEKEGWAIKRPTGRIALVRKWT